MKAALLGALRVVARADSDPTRTVLFERLAARQPAVRLARGLTHGALRGSWLSALAVAGYGLYTARVCVRAPREPIWALPLFENDRREIDRIAGWLGGGRVGRSGRAGLAAGAFGLLRRTVRGDAWRYLRVVRRLCRRHEFLVACRAASALAAAMAAAGALRTAPVRAVLVSSDYNAEVVGLVHAAREAGRATIYVPHAPTQHLSPPLHFTLALLDGEAALAAYARKGPVRATCVFKGVAGEEAPLDLSGLARTSPTVGVFLPKEVEWEALRLCCEAIRRRFHPARLLLRCHPNAMEGPPPGLLSAGAEVCPARATLGEDARRCDWVVADENSSVPLGVLKAGVPAVVVAGLAVFPPGQRDLYGLAADRVVPSVSLDALDLRALDGFFREGWADRFRRHDASYGRGAEVRAAVRSAVLAAMGEPVS